MDPEKEVLSDEAIAEQEKIAVAEADLRSKIVAELGLTEDDTNKEFIDKIVKREAGLRQGFGKLLGDYKTLKTKVPKPPQQTSPTGDKSFDAESIRKAAVDATKETLAQEYLDEMEYPEEIATEIKDFARFKGISVRKAEDAPHIKQMIAEAVTAGRITEAATTRTSRSTTPQKEGMPKFDMATEEGRNAYEEWKKSKK